MKQDGKSGNSGGGQGGVMSSTAPKEIKRNGETNDDPSAVSGSGDTLHAPGSDGEEQATDTPGDDSAADSTSHELNTSANTSGSSLGEECSSSSRSETVVGTAAIGRSSENEMERSSCDDSVSESNPSSSGSSIQSGAIDKSERNCENNETDHSHPPSEAVPNLDDRQTESGDESLSESNPRDSLTSSSVSSTPSVVSDRSGRNSGTSDTDQSPSNPPPKTAPISDERQAGGVGDTPNDQDTASQDARSAGNKMTLRSGKVTQAESVVPKKQRDTSKMQRRSSARTTKRRCSVDELSHSSSEEIPEKLIRLELPETSTVQDTDYSTGFVNNLSGDNVSKPLPRENTKLPVKSDDAPLHEALDIKSDDAPLLEASDTTHAEQEEPAMGNEKSEDEKLDTNGSEVTQGNEKSEDEKLDTNRSEVTQGNEKAEDEKLDTNRSEVTQGNEKSEDAKLDTNSSEVTPYNDLVSVIKEEVLDEASTHSESSAYQSADNTTGMDSLSHTDIGADEDFCFRVKLEVPEEPEFNAPSGSNSGVNIEDMKGTQAGGPESRTSRDSESCSDDNEFAPNCASELMADAFEDDSCDDFEECNVEAVDNALQENSVHTFTAEMKSGSREMSPDVRTTPCQSTAVCTINAQSTCDRLVSDVHFERNVPLNSEVNLRGQRLQPLPQAVKPCEAQESTAVPDSSTEEAMGEITPNTDTNMQQQMSTNISQSLDTDATTDEQMNCASHHHDSLTERTKKNSDDMPRDNRNTTSSVTQDTECKTAENVPEDAGDLESPIDAQFEQRNLQIYRYITTSGASDVRYSPYVTRRRPLRSGYSSGENHRRFFVRGRRREARQTDDNDHQTPSGGQASFGDSCSIS